MPSTPSPEGSSYRSLLRLGPDPVTEADAIVELMGRTTALRRKLLSLTIAASFGGGIGALALYVTAATQIDGRVCGGCFAVGAMLTFIVVRRVSDLVACRWQARWIADSAARHALDEGPLAEALAMFRS